MILRHFSISAYILCFFVSVFAPTVGYHALKFELNVKVPFLIIAVILARGEEILLTVYKKKNIYRG